MASEVVQLAIPNVPVEIKEALEAEAKRQDRSMSSLVRTILVDYFQRQDTNTDNRKAKATA